MRTSYLRLFGAACLLALLTGCERPATAESTSALPTVWVSIAPQAFLVEAMAGDLVSVQVLLKPGQGPETYSPSAAELAQVARANLYFGIGMPIERPVLSGIQSGTHQVEYVRTGVELSHFDGHHVHGPSCDHGTDDPHIWVDPLQMLELSQRMEAALIRHVPDHAATIVANTANLHEQLLALDVELQELLAPYAGRGFFINHPSLGHFAKRYGLEQFSIEQVGTSPSARRIADLIQLAQDEQIGAVLTQPEFGRSSAEVLARELGLTILVVDPLAPDYLQNMRRIGAAIVKGFGDE